jgi:hypothetical protein
VEGPLSQKAARRLRGPGIPDPVPGVAIPRKMLGHKVLSSLECRVYRYAEHTFDKSGQWVNSLVSCSA